MLSDLSQYDLLSLILANDWPEEKKEELFGKYNAALEGYVAENIAKYFTKEDDEYIKRLTENSETTEEILVTFYQKKIPNFQETIQTLTLQFKKLFLMSVYDQQLQTLKETIAEYREIKKQLPEEITDAQIKRREAEHDIWLTIHHEAEQDHWSEVAEKLQSISSLATR